MNTNEIIRLAISEDIGNGDHTSLATIPSESLGKAQLKAKEEGILAGIFIAEKVFKTIDPSIIFTPFKIDGQTIANGDIIFSVEGEDVYGNLKFEAGVHRVQRVPQTETQGLSLIHI